MKATIVLWTLLAAVPQEQDPRQAHPIPVEMQPFEALLGTWKGEGRVTLSPGTEPDVWTGSLHAKRILNATAVQVDEHYEGAMGAMSFRTLYGWDRERSQLFCAWVGDVGPGGAQVAWIDETTLVGTQSEFEDGTPSAGRWWLRREGEALSIRMDRALGSEPFATMMEGRYERSREPIVLPGQENSPGPKMQALAPIIGSYSLTGKGSMAGVEMEVTARETNEWMHGGAVIATHILGQPGDYMAHAYLCWDESDGHYTHLFASSSGEIGLQKGFLVDDRFVLIGTAPRLGQVGAGRTVIEFEDGAMARSWNERMNGARAAARVFEASYQRSGSDG